MSIAQVILSADFILAMTIYGITTLAALPLFDYIHDRLEHPVLQYPWEHIAMPLLRAGLMFIFIWLAYPLLFGIKEAPSLWTLMSSNELRINYLINLIFILTLLFPLIPIIGAWAELVLPAQGIAACIMIFSWLTEALGMENVSYWPGLKTIVVIMVIALLGHWLSNWIALHIGGYLDKKLNVEHAEELLARAIIVLMQSPAILVFSLGLGQQLKLGT